MTAAVLHLAIALSLGAAIVGAMGLYSVGLIWVDKRIELEDARKKVRP